ncbi:MAG: thioredoxin family protein [Candidatus Delongbacteria bacterium]|jgi:protein disulfide-isomerase|nr:thioredoxin family protein [Candidatus Delongbacteria bacterium]
MKIQHILLIGMVLVGIYYAFNNYNTQNNSSEKVEVLNSLAVGKWETSYSTAIKKAKDSGKMLLLDFTGSDWCGWCVKLDNEVFSKKEFQDYADKNLILLKLDFPRAIKQSNELKKQNRALASKFGIKGYPTIIVLNNNEKLIGRTGYQKGGPKKYIAHLKGLIGTN